MNKEVYVNIKISMPNGSDMSFSDEEIKEIQDYYEKEFSNFDYLVGEINVSFIDEKTKQIDQLKQQLEEKDKEIAHLKEKDNYHLRYELAGADETITNLKEQLAEKDIRIEELEGQFAYECECNKQLVELQKQLEEKQNTIDEINKEFVQAVHDWKALCAEKDKEIEKLKQQYTILENENGKLTTELIMDKYKKAKKEVSFGKQLTIQELEKVKNKCNGMYELWLDSNYKENMYNNEDIAGVFEDIGVFTNDLIKKLKGE